MNIRHIQAALAALAVILGGLVCTSSFSDDAKTDVDTKESAPLSAASQVNDQKEYQQDLEVLRTFQKKSNLEDLKEFADPRFEKWEKRNQNLYFDWTLDVCQLLTSYDFGSDDRFALAESYAEQALKQRENMSVGVEAGIVSCLTHDIDYLSGKTIGKEWAEIRKKKADLWLHAMSRLDKSIDKKFDPNDQKNWPVSNVMPPIGRGDQILVPGMDPNDVKNLKSRVQYQALIKANNDKAGKLNDQLLFRRIRSSFFRIAERYIVVLYSRNPHDTKELKDLFKAYPIDEKSKATILSHIDKNNAPDKLGS